MQLLAHCHLLDHVDLLYLSASRAQSLRSSTCLQVGTCTHQGSTDAAISGTDRARTKRSQPAICAASERHPVLSMQCLAHLLEAVANDGLVQVGRPCELVDAAPHQSHMSSIIADKLQQNQ